VAPSKPVRPVQKLRRFLVIATLVVVAAGAYGCNQLGRFLAREDPLARADAIFIFAGSQAERPLEAAELYHAGYAPLLVLTRPQEEPAVEVLARRGIELPTRFALMRQVLQKLDVPDAVIIIPERVHDNTAQEAETLRALAVARGWRRVILVSSKYHLRRVGMASRRALRGTGVVVMLRASRYDPSVPEEWWQHRPDLRLMLWEVPKVLGYAVGVGE
jgi:uncharacterized SAM-binding protein YcdF (DUF218 family)